MKTTPLVIGIGAILALGSIWAGRMAWRAHHNLVTLQVRNAPLAEVVAKIQRQTQEKVRLDPKLDAKITLDVKNMPLSEVLDLVSDQAGARWGKTYAVYHDDRALSRLDMVFRGSSELDAAGWTNLAPHFGATDLAEMKDFASGQGPVKVITHPGGGGGSVSGGGSVRSEEDIQRIIGEAEKAGAIVTQNENGSVRTVTRSMKGPGGERVIRMGPGADGSPDHVMRNVMVRRTVGPGGSTTTTTDGDGKVRTVRTSEDGTVLKEDQWSAERLVLETTLSPQLGSELPAKANLETATKTAGKVHGKCVTYYALEKPPIALAPGMGGLARSSIRGIRMGETNRLSEGDIRGRIEAEARQRKLDELAKSPEQQVQRARQKQEAQSGK